MTMKNMMIGFIFVAVVLLNSEAIANSTLPIKPGLWETTMTQTNSFSGTTTSTETECVKETSVNPQDFMKELQGCEINQSLVSGKTMTVNMSCSIQGMKASLDGKIISDGDHGEGDMTMSMEMPGMKMQMDMKWQAKRLGDC